MMHLKAQMNKKACEAEARALDLEKARKSMKFGGAAHSQNTVRPNSAPARCTYAFSDSDVAQRALRSQMAPQPPMLALTSQATTPPDDLPAEMPSTDLASSQGRCDDSNGGSDAAAISVP